MPKESTTIEGALLPDMVYREALRRMEALIGCTEGSLEEAQLIHWATIADNYERATGIDNDWLNRRDAWPFISGARDEARPDAATGKVSKSSSGR
jgi:hypothetical protein